MSPLSWDNLYSHHPEEYELLVSHEDFQGHLLPAIQGIQPLAGQRAVEFGCGTGRVTSLLAGAVQRLYAFDLNAPMLRTAQGRLRRGGWEHVSLALADSRRMPVRAGPVDFAIEGWAFLQIAVWHWDAWQAELGRALDEMQRVVRPGGKSILIETLGTGETEPNPAANFRIVYDWLEVERGFHPEWIRTDYRFESMEPVREVVVPLFGEGMLERLVPTSEGFVLPECTGLWWRGVTPPG